jgi:methylmalonyl-CoA/ethylmalonyl-CoA epimerase
MGNNTSKPRLHHVGIAVNQIAPVQNCLEAALGVTFSEPESVENQGVLVSFAELADGSALELVQATQDQSPKFPLLRHPIRSHIEKHGTGLHPLAIEVPDIDVAIANLKSRNIRTLTDAPDVGAGGRRAIFLNPLDCEGILLELFEVSDS